MSTKSPDELAQNETFPKSPPNSNVTRRVWYQSSQGCCAKCCGWKCCGIVTLVIVIILGAALLGGYLWFRSRLGEAPSTEDAQLWEEKLGGQQAGGAGSITGE